MERCQEHMVVGGSVERSVKEAGNVVRTRRCVKCGSLFKTFEMTDDAVALQLVGQEGRIKVLEVELDFYKQVVRDLRAVYTAERQVRTDLIDMDEFGNEAGE